MSLDTGVNSQALIQCSCLELQQWVPPGFQPLPSSRLQGLSLSHPPCGSPWQCLWSARTRRLCQAHRALLLWTIGQLWPETPRVPQTQGSHCCLKSAKMQRVLAGAAGPRGTFPEFPWLYSGAGAMAATAPGFGDHPAVGEGLLTLLLLLISRLACHQEKTGA